MIRTKVTAQRRNKTEIVAEILRIAKKGARKTRIVYTANLNFKLLNEYLGKLEKAGLIDEDNDENGIIKTSEKGERYLQYYKGLKDFGIL